MAGLTPSYEAYKADYNRSPYEMPQLPSKTDYGIENAGTDFLKGFGSGMITGNPAAAITMGVITLLGGLLQGLTARPAPLTPEQKAYANMIGYYKKVGARYQQLHGYKRAMLPKRNIASSLIKRTAGSSTEQIDWDGIVKQYPYPEGGE